MGCGFFYLDFKGQGCRIMDFRFQFSLRELWVQDFSLVELWDVGKELFWGQGLSRGLLQGWGFFIELSDDVVILVKWEVRLLS